MSKEKSIYRLSLYDPTPEQRRQCANRAYNEMHDQADSPLERALFRYYIPQSAINDYVTRLWWLARLEEQQLQKKNGKIIPQGDGSYFVSSVMARVFWFVHPCVSDGYMDTDRAQFLIATFQEHFMSELYELFLPSQAACRLDAIVETYDSLVADRVWAELPGIKLDEFKRYASRYEQHDNPEIVSELEAYLGRALQDESKLSSQKIALVTSEFSGHLWAQLNSIDRKRRALIPATR